MPRIYTSDDLANEAAVLLANDTSVPPDSGVLPDSDSDPGSTPDIPPGGTTTNESFLLTAGASLDRSDGWPFKVSIPGMDSSNAPAGAFWGSGHTNSSSSSTDHDVSDVTGWISNDPHLFGASVLPTDSGLPGSNPSSAVPPDSTPPTTPTVPTTPFRDSDPSSALPPDPGSTPPGTPFIDSHPGSAQPVEFPWRNADGIVNTNWDPTTGAPLPDSSGAAGHSTQSATDHAGGYHFGDWHLI